MRSSLAACDRLGLLPSVVLKTVLLLHTLPDHSRHYDWLIQRDADPGILVPTFRIEQRIDIGAPCTFLAERIADHRSLYLDYEGEITGGRGEVARVAQGQVQIRRWLPQKIDLSLVFDGRSRSVVGVVGVVGIAIGGPMWRFEIGEHDR